MLGTAHITAFLATTNATRATSFYGATLGLRLVSEDAFALVFDANGVELRIQKVEQFTPQPFTAIGWRVADLAHVVHALGERGVGAARLVVQVERRGDAALVGAIGGQVLQARHLAQAAQKSALDEAPRVLHRRGLGRHHQHADVRDQEEV